MRKIENIVIAVCMVANTGLLIALVWITSSVKHQLTERPGQFTSMENGRAIEQALHENQSKIDSVRADSVLSVGDAARKLQERYRRR